MADGLIGHLLCWERHVRDSSWTARVSRIQESSDRTVHEIVLVPSCQQKSVGLATIGKAIAAGH
jgi:hypothetical protein